MIIGMVFSLVKWTALFFIGLIALALLIGVVGSIADNPENAGGAVKDFVHGVWDVVSGIFTFGKEIAEG